MNAAIIGGGNIGTYFACELSSKGFDVRIYTSRPQEWHENIESINENGIIYGKISLASDNISQVLNDCDLIFITHPASCFRELDKIISPYIKMGVYLGIIPGTGGAEFQFTKCIKKGAVLFGLQRVPAVARIIKYGHSVRTEGKRDKLKLAAIPNYHAKKLADLISKIFDMPCDILPNYLNVTLTPSNPILHTSRLRVLFKNYHDGIIYPENFLFYGGWNDESSSLLFALDNELQEICEILSKKLNINLSEVKSLRIHYESSTPSELTRKIKSISSLNKLYSPMKKLNDGGYIPDFSSRYFTSDFPYGLAVIESIANLIGYNAKEIVNTMDWYRNLTGDYSRFELNLKNFDIYTLDKNNQAAIIDKTRQDKTRQDKTRQDKTLILPINNNNWRLAA